MTKRLIFAGIALASVAVFAWSSRWNSFSSYFLAPQSRPQQGVSRHGLVPAWNIEQMVAHSDRAAIGTVTRLIDEQRVRSPAPLGEVSRYVDVIKDYEVAVERFIFPRAQLARKVVIRTRAGIESADGKTEVSVEDDLLQEFHIGERVLLFLEVLPERAYSEEGLRVPSGTERSDYHAIVISTGYGKLNAVGDTWRDNRSTAETTVDRIEAAARSQGKQ